MQKKYKQYLFLVTAIYLFSLIINTSYAQEVEDIIKAQKEINIAADEQTKERLAKQKLLEETKDAIKMGNKEYEQTCSLCHGIDAKGHGAYAFVLKESPADLTHIKKRNNGVFPFSKLYRIIDGREEIKSHGTRTMPIWGNRFNSENWLNISPRYSETLVRGRIFELLLYLETIQK